MDKYNFNNHLLNNTCRVQDRSEQRRLDCEGREDDKICNSCENKCQDEHGGEVYSANISKIAFANQNFRESVWTGKYLQMTLMSIPCRSEIGVELHSDTDQYIRVEHGIALALTGNNKDALCNKYKLNTGEAIFIPAGVWHNIINIGRRSLKISSVYAPPHHPKCTVEKTK